MLTLENQYRLDDLLRQENLLTNEDLIAELTDHYSVALEERLAQEQDAETALLAINADFGGRKGLQQLERKYNRVTFRRYDKLWWEFLKTMPKRSNDWLQLGISMWCCYSLVTDSNKDSWAIYGFMIGISMFVLMGLQLPLWTYLKNMITKGYHNPPTEVQYLMSRVVFVTTSFWLLGGLLMLLTSTLPQLGQSVIQALYLMAMFIYLMAYGKVYQHLYKTDDFRWA